MSASFYCNIVFYNALVCFSTSVAVWMGIRTLTKPKTGTEIARSRMKATLCSARCRPRWRAARTLATSPRSSSTTSTARSNWTLSSTTSRRFGQCELWTMLELWNVNRLLCGCRDAGRRSRMSWTRARFTSTLSSLSFSALRSVYSWKMTV